MNSNRILGVGEWLISTMVLSSDVRCFDRKKLGLLERRVKRIKRNYGVLLILRSILQMEPDFQLREFNVVDAFGYTIFF